MKKYSALLLLIFILSFPQLQAQSVILEGYAYETDNRGYLNEVYITVYDEEKVNVKAQAVTNFEGYFTVEVPVGEKYTLVAKKDLFFEMEVKADATDKIPESKIFVKFELEREPGYLFDVTIAPERDSEDVEVDGIIGAKIEIYNNTTEEQILNIESHPSMNFQFTFKKGNHYTVLVRKEGYFTKRMEAFVNVDGCILCFEGIGGIRPAVTDNLTAGHEMGTLLANVELKPIELGESIPLNNIYYNYNSAEIRDDAIQELETLIDILRDNPHLIVELGSHTDSRGNPKYNQQLSQKRAQSVVDYLITQGNIYNNRIQAKGYGATNLVNKCSPGVECTEDQHQQNRRTELTIVGFLDVDPMKHKSLKDIKEEEMVEALLREVQNSEVIEIPESGEMPESLKNQLEDESEKAEEKIDSFDTIQADILMVTDTLSEKNMDVSEEVSPSAKDKLSQIFDEKNEMSPDVEEIQNPVNKLEETKNSIVEIDESINGFLIQIMHSSNVISNVDNLWQDRGVIYQEKRVSGGYSYLIGVYESREKARASMQGRLSGDFPDAFIVEFNKGKRIK